MKVTKDTPIIDVLNAHPDAIKVFLKYQMGCVGCYAASNESIEAGAAMHGLDPQVIVDELNTLFEKNE